MPSTRKKVYADNETAKNCRIYKKTTVANVNNNARQSKIEEGTEKVQPKRKNDRALSKSPAKKMSKQKGSLKVGENAAKSKPATSTEDEPENESKQSQEFEFEEDGQVIRMAVERGDESYASSSDNEDTADESGTEYSEIDQEISFCSERARSSRSRSRSGVETATDSDSNSRGSQSSKSSADKPMYQEYQETERQTQRISQQFKRIKTIQDKQQRLKELDEEMALKLQEIQSLMETEGLSKSAQVISNQMIRREPNRMATQTNFNNAGTNYNENSANKDLINKENKCQSQPNIENSNRPMNATSEETIYRRAVPDKINSSSSDDDCLVNTSDELITAEFGNLKVISPQIISGDRNRPRRQEPVPSTSREVRRADPTRSPRTRPAFITPDQRMEENIRDAELSRAIVFPASGNYNVTPKYTKGQYVNTAMMDEDYITVGSHLDEVTLNKIKNSEYVDFGKLIPKDRILATEENRLELVMKGGHTYYVPVAETTEISNFNRWEQAFRVYSNIYTKFYPHRSSELIEYNHIIHTISLSYPWENVYLYDKDFRIHISKHPERNWSIILQQAWALRLRDRPGYVLNNQGNSSHNSKNSASPETKVDECRRYNRGLCPFGSGCRYEHRCQYCFQLGHPIIRCRKLMADKERDRLRGHKRNNGDNKFEGKRSDHENNGNSHSKKHMARQS